MPYHGMFDGDPFGNRFGWRTPTEDKCYLDQSELTKRYDLRKLLVEHAELIQYDDLVSLIKGYMGEEIPKALSSVLKNVRYPNGYQVSTSKTGKFSIVKLKDPGVVGLFRETLFDASYKNGTVDPVWSVHKIEPLSSFVNDLGYSVDRLVNR